MRIFDDKSRLGNEKAFRKGKTVPEGDVNLAYYKAPALSPDKNVVILDASRIIEENIENTGITKKLYYANAIGILEDDAGNQLVNDEFPIIADTFTVDEDFNSLPGSEYTAQDMLPFIHVSRHFHLDYWGQATSGTQVRVDNRFGISVVDTAGHDYVDEDGKPRYAIYVTAAPFSRPSIAYDQTPYRVIAYVDTDTNEDLYLSYNKCELDTNYLVTEFEPNWRERLNPTTYYDYHPEESLIVDPENRQQRWFSTKPLAYKDNLLGIPRNSNAGYRAFVPRKAVSDPRVFQLFRWRAKCQFTQPYTVDPDTRPQSIRAGVIITNSDRNSRAAYAFLNLQRSGYNATGVRFENPLKTDSATPSSDSYQEWAEYWHVNLDTVSFSDLKKFDILIWAPSGTTFSFAPYANKINYFTNDLKGTLFIDTNTYTYSTDAGATMSAAVNPANGSKRSIGTFDAYTSNISASVNTSSNLIMGLASLGGWNIQNSGNDSPLSTLSYMQNVNTAWYSQQITTLPTGWTSIWSASTGGGTRYLTIQRSTPSGGNVILSTAGTLFTCSSLYSFASNSIVSDNLGTHSHVTDSYNLYINSTRVEGAMKFLFNASMLAVKGRILNDDDQSQYSTTWSYASPWQSSWVINASNDVLSESERSRFDFVLSPKDVATPTPVWQRKLSDKTLKQILDESLTAEMKRLIEGAVRTYEIEVTNLNVETPAILSDNSRPYAWTEVYSPSFTVPADIGPHVVKEEETKGDYDAGQYVYRSYPNKPYAAQVQVSYIDTMEKLVPSQVQWTAIGTATETITITESVPPSSSTSTSMVELNYQEHGVNRREIAAADQPPYGGTYRPEGLYMLQEFQYRNYYPGNSTNNWVNFGLYGQWGPGSSGEPVQFLQWALNRIQFFGEGRFYHGYLAEDGYYGGSTANAITNFQAVKRAKFVDGVVDAETLSLLGAELQGLGALALSGTSYDDYTRWGIYAAQQANIHGMADGGIWTTFTKRSWVNSGPYYVWDTFFAHYKQSYKIHGITIIPQADVGDLIVSAWDVSNSLFYPMWVYDSWNAVVIRDTRLASGERHFEPLGPYIANSVAITLGQDRATWPTGSRQFGVHDILPLAEVSTTTTIPGYTKIIKQNRTIAIGATGTITMTHDKTTNVNVIPAYTGTGQISNIQWTSISANNASVNATITSNGLATFRIDAMTTALNTNNPSTYTFGPTIPGGTFYSMDENKRKNPLPETGWISKIDGIKLLCKADKTPHGFTAINGAALFPTGVGAEEKMRHYTKIRLIGFGNDVNVRIGFYDVAKQEFVTNAAGQPEMSYIEYQTRGPQNIFIGLVSNYEVDTLQPIPVNEDAPTLPYRWAMPVYGVMTRGRPRITLESIPKNLGVTDVWPIAIKTGRFDRRVKLQTVSPITGPLTSYQNQIVHAFYGIPEAAAFGWSELFGRPYVDIKNEQPILNDTDAIQVRQPPFKMHRVPNTTNNPNASPMLPQFKVFTRATVGASWVQLTLDQITDWNASTGEIFLADDLASLDAELVRVDYVTSRRNFHFKGFASAILNLNPYPGPSRNLIGTALYIYILPEFVRDKNETLISGTTRTSTVNYTLDPNIFDPIRPEYNPLAVLLGVVYLTPSIDINELSLFDTRRRGGGAKNTATTDDILRLTQEAANYWDVSYGAGESYQKGGFVIIRLPVELKTYFSETEITTVIERNITAGVRFKIEDLNGNDW